VIEVAEAVGGVVIIIPVDVQFFNAIVDILTKFNIPVCGTATFVLVRRNVDPKALKVREAISGDQYFCSFSFYHLDTLIIISGTHLAPVPPIVKVI